MRVFRTILPVLGGVGATAVVLSATPLSLNWYTIDGGGIMHLSGRGFDLSGTIGQPDACGPLSGRGFELTGGFWFGIPPGDCNSDGGVSLLDYRDFENCLGGPSRGVEGSTCFCFDQDEDGDVDLADFAFVQVEHNSSQR